jgi:hypothetical protein
MTYNFSLKESRAQIVVKEMNNGTKIVTEPDSNGWVSLEVHIDTGYDALCLYHAGMSACRQMDREFDEARKVSVTVA